MKTIYAIRDRVANDLAGYYPLVVFRNDAQAVRYFGDSLAQEKSALGAHPNDYELIKIAYLNDDGEIGHILDNKGLICKPQLIITGSTLIAASTPPEA